MDTAKSLLLFSLVLFCIYAQQKAARNVGSLHSNKGQQLHAAAGVLIGDMDFLRRAKLLSHKTDGDLNNHLFGCVLVKDHKVVGEGWNKIESSSHAEVHVIADACRNVSLSTLKESVLYTSAKPCPACLSFIHQAGIKKVYYSPSGNTEIVLDSAISEDDIFNSIGTSQSDAQLQPEVGAANDEVNY